MNLLPLGKDPTELNSERNLHLNRQHKRMSYRLKGVLSLLLNTSLKANTFDHLSHCAKVAEVLRAQSAVRGAVPTVRATAILPASPLGEATDTNASMQVDTTSSCPSNPGMGLQVKAIVAVDTH
eukprot:5727459-Amphidinium_carterae.1